MSSALPRQHDGCAQILVIALIFNYLHAARELYLGNLAGARSKPAPSHPLYTQHNLPEGSVNFLSHFVNFVQLMRSRVPESCSFVFFR